MIRQELYKIWRPKRLILLVLLGFVFYTMYLQFYITYFPNGSDNAGIFQVSRELIEENGPKLLPEKAEELQKQIPVLYEEAADYIRVFPLCRKYGLKTYTDYQTFYQACLGNGTDSSGMDQESAYADAMVIGNYLQSEETNNIGGRIYAVKLFIEQYGNMRRYSEQFPATGLNDGYSNREYKHILKTFFGSDEAWQNILPIEVPETTSAYFGFLLIWMCLSVCLLLSPFMVSDHLCRIKPLQWSSRLGRGITVIQFKAVMLSAFLLTTINLIIFGGMLITRQISVFFPCKMFSFLFTGISWPDWTYGVWCVVLVFLCYLVTMGTAAFVFLLSRSSGNYITMLLKVILLFALMVLISMKLMNNAFYFGNAIYQLTHIPYGEGILAVVLFATGIVLCTTICKHQQKEDLLV